MVFFRFWIRKSENLYQKFSDKREWQATLGLCPFRKNHFRYLTFIVTINLTGPYACSSCKVDNMDDGSLCLNYFCICNDPPKIKKKCDDWHSNSKYRNNTMMQKNKKVQALKNENEKIRNNKRETKVMDFFSNLQKTREVAFKKKKKKIKISHDVLE